MSDKYACVMFKCAADADALKELLDKFGLKPWRVTLEEPDYVDAMSLVLNEMNHLLYNAVAKRKNAEAEWREDTRIPGKFYAVKGE